jgi:hypothetical protein
MASGIAVFISRVGGRARKAKRSSEMMLRSLIHAMPKKNSHRGRPMPFRWRTEAALRFARPWPPRFFIPFGIGCLFAGASVTRVDAQDALQSALSLDSILQAQQNSSTEIPPGQPRLGPVQLSLGVYSGVQYNNNINLAQYNPQSDVILGNGVNLGAFWPVTALSELNFSSAVGYNYYLEHPNQSYVNVAPGSALNWSVLLEEWTLTLYDQFSYTHNVNTIASVSNTYGIPAFNNIVGLRGEWQPDHWDVQLGYSYVSYISDAAAYDYLNNNADNFFARGAWRFADATQLGLEASSAITKYSHVTEPDSTSYSLGPYLQWQVTKAINNSLRGGWTYYSFDATPFQPASTLNSYYFGLDLSHQLTKYVSQTFSAERDVSLGFNTGGAYTQQFTAIYGVQWSATPWLNLMLNLTYEKGQQPLSGTSTMNTENYDRYGVSPGISYQLTQKLSGSLSYSFWDKSSNVNGNSYQQDTLSLQLQYRF